MDRRHGGTTKPTAVVAGIDLNGLGVIRSLAKAAIPTIALDTDLSKATMATRFGKKLLVPALSGRAFIDALLEVAGALDRKPVLFLTQEDSVATVAAAGECLADAYEFSMPSLQMMQMLMDKRKFQRTAEELNLPIPRSLHLVGDMNVDTVGGLRFPCALKPLKREPEYSRRFAKAYKVSSADEAVALWTQVREVISEAILQEWIEGDDSDVYFCLQYRRPAGPPHVSFVGRKTCQWPPLVGGTASCVPAREAWEELVELTDAFFGTLGFVGLCSMEYKRDTRDRKFYAVEPTVGRTDYQEEIATLNGVNIPEAAYLGELGRMPPPVSLVSPSRAWRDPIGSYRAIQAGAKDATARVIPDARICDAYFRLSDPGPFLSLKSEALKRRLSHLRF